jgi:hypothetical protein
LLPELEQASQLGDAAHASQPLDRITQVAQGHPFGQQARAGHEDP